MRRPTTQYARVGDDRVAYQVSGDGPPDLVLTTGPGHVDLRWDDAVFEDFYRRIATLGRLIVFDGRGTGASDPLPADTPLAWESWVEDLTVVLDAVGSASAVIFGALDAGPSAVMFAATRPERTAALVLFNTTARMLAAPEYPAGHPPEAVRDGVRLFKKAWGTPQAASVSFPERAADESFRSWLAKYQRASLSPRVHHEHVDQVATVDVREFLPMVRSPTLVLYCDNPFFPIAQAEYVAAHIDGARLVALPGRGLGIFQHVDATFGALREFLTGDPAEAQPDRVLATVLFTDIVDSTGSAAALGDRRWRQVLDRHDHAAHVEVERFRGTFVKSTGDGILATFDAPTRALRCAFRLTETLGDSGLHLRAGLHAGEIELRGDDVGGIGVHLARRTADEAGPQQILVTRTVRDLVTGSDLVFIPRGPVKLRGVPDEWELFEAQVG